MSVEQSLASAIPDMVIDGTGTSSPPGGSAIPPPTAEDLALDPVSSHAYATEMPEEVFSLPCAAWIRRAVHAEAFAKALEAELERLRAGMK